MIHPMRRLRHLVETMVETPMSDFQRIGSGGDNFSDPDDRFIRDPQTPERMRIAFSRIPYDFAFYFAYNEIDDDAYSNAVEECKLYSKADIAAELGIDVPYDPKAITILVIQNGSMTPFTPWVLAHDSAHSIMNCVGDLHKLVDDTVDTIAKARFRKIDSASRKRVIQAIGTMASARDAKRYFDSGEFTPEVFAQYLITGKVTLRPISGFEDFIRQAETNINQAIDAILRQSVGKIFIR